MKSIDIIIAASLATCVIALTRYLTTLKLLFTTIYQAYGPHMAKLYCMERHNCIVDDCCKILGEDYSLKHIERGRGESNMQHAVSGPETSGLRKLDGMRFMDNELNGVVMTETFGN